MMRPVEREPVLRAGDVGERRMDSFRWMSVILSMVLGLGVTRLLSGLVTVFRSRKRSEIDWIPIVWACCIFLTQLQYWWAVTSLPLHIADWSFEEFVSLVLLTMLLFLSGALLLPSEELSGRHALRAFFEDEGRWGLVACAAFLLLTIPANIFFFDAPPYALWDLTDLPLIVLPLVVFFSRSRRIQAVATLAYVPLLLFDTWLVNDVGA